MVGGALRATIRPAPPSLRGGRVLLGATCGRAFALLLATLALTYFRAGDLSAQAPQFRHLGTDAGLPSGWVTAILQDHIGYMWFGTANGVGRYDGDTVRVYRRRPDDASSLPDNKVNALLEDRSGTLWVGTTALSRYDRGRDAFVHFMVGGPGEEGRFIGSLLEDSRGQLWVGTNFGIYLFDRATGRERRLEVPWGPGSTRESQRVLLEDRRRHVWIASPGQGLADYDPATGAFRVFRRDGSPGGLPDDNVHALREDAGGRLWLGTGSAGLVLLDLASGSFRSHARRGEDPGTLARNRIRALLPDGAGGYWVGSDGGLDHFGADRRFVHYAADARNPTALNDESIWSLHRDASGILWVGTYAGGLNLLSRQGDAIRLYQVVPGDTTSLANPYIQSLAQDAAGTVWVANGLGGVARFDLQAGRFTRFNRQPDGLNALAVAPDRDGAVWVGTWAGGLCRLDPRSRVFTCLTKKNSTIPTDNTSSVHVDRHGTLWVGTQAGLLRYERVGQSFVRYPLVPPGRRQDHIWQILELADGRFALATGMNGLVLFDPRSGATRSYWAQRGRADALGADEVRSLLEAEPGILWVGTSAGLDRLDLRTGRISHITEAQGLPGPVVSGVALDASGNLWISTANAGIVRFRHGIGATRYFTKEDGLQGWEFNAHATLRLRDGTLLFGGSRGLNVIRPDRLVPNPRRPPVVLTRLELFNRPVAAGVPGSPLERAIGETRHLVLRHNQSMFTLGFAALDYVAPGRNQFAYKLEGFDRDWVHVGSARTASYAGLPPGSYVFRVIASNNDGLWNERGASLRITIEPPLTGTWWFRLLVVLLVAGAAVIAIVAARRRHLLLRSMNAQLAAAAERDRSAEQDLERNVLNVLADMRRSAAGDESVPVPVEGDEAIAALRRGIGEILADRRRAEEDLRQSQKLEAVGRLAGGVAHDFNNLLTVINGNLTLALGEVGGDRNLRLELEEVRRAAESAASLTGQLLAVSHKQVLQPRLLALNALVQEVGRMLVRSAGGSVQLEMRLDPDLGRVHADRGQIEQILLNLVVNARDAMPQGGTIIIETRNVAGAQVPASGARGDRHYVALSVRDTGSGMTPEVREHIFEPFFTTKEVGKGTGLGLSTVYAVVEQNGGYLEVETAPGAGTTLSVYLPRSDESPPAETASAAALPTKAPGAGVTVLLAEDEDALRRLAARVLQRAGYIVLEASDGPRALEVAAGYPGTIDLLLTDVVMPGMSGRELAELLLPRRPGMRLLYTSGYTEDDIVRHGVSGEGAPFLPKPFTPDQLLRKVRAVLDESPAGDGAPPRQGSAGRGA